MMVQTLPRRCLLLLAYAIAGGWPGILATKESAAEQTLPRPEERLSTAARTALQNGRQLDQKGDLPGALAAFTQANKLAPNSVPILSELGWTAVRSGKLELAREVSTTAIKIAFLYSFDRKSLAGIYFNRGRAHEGLGNRMAALVDYRLSFDQHPAAEVRQRLESLAAQQLAEKKPLPLAYNKMQKVAGLSAFCAQARESCQTKDGLGDGPREFSCEVTKNLAETKPPFLAVQIWEEGCRPPDSGLYSSHVLAIKQKMGWFVTEVLQATANYGRVTESLDPVLLTIRELGQAAPHTGPTPMGQQMVLLHYRNGRHDNSNFSLGGKTAQQHEYVVVAALGPSGTLWYVEPILVSARADYEFPWDMEGLSPADIPDYSVYAEQLRFEFLPTGELVLSPAAKSTVGDLMSAEIKLTEHLGRHKLVFP